MPALPVHHTAVDTESEWDAQENLRRLGKADATKLREMHAWVDPDEDPDTKGAYKFPHHNVSESGDVGAANLRALAAGIAALNGARGGAKLSERDRREVYRHLAAHYADADLDAPPLEELASYMDDVELVAEVKAVDGAIGMLRGVVSVYDSIDQMGDRIKKGAFRATVAENPVVPLLWQHDTSAVIGTAKITDTGKRIVADMELDMEDPLAASAYRKVRKGMVKGMSIGFTPTKVTWVDDGDEIIREISELKLWEVSLVTFPALPEAQVISAKMRFGGCAREADAEHAAEPDEDEAKSQDLEEVARMIREFKIGG